LQLFVVLDELRLELDHPPLPVLHPLLQRLAGEDARLLLDVLARAPELRLPGVELLLALVEELLQRRLGADAVLGLHDRVLNVDHRDLAALRAREARGESERGGGGEGDSGDPGERPAQRGGHDQAITRRSLDRQAAVTGTYWRCSSSRGRTGR
jgi:hypothetical protein